MSGLQLQISAVRFALRCRLKDLDARLKSKTGMRWTGGLQSQLHIRAPITVLLLWGGFNKLGTAGLSPNG